MVISTVMLNLPNSCNKRFMMNLWQMQKKEKI